MRAITVLDILEETAVRLPDKVYLEDEVETVTYGQCMEDAMRLGYALGRELDGIGEKKAPGGVMRRPVILFMDKSCRCVISMLGVLYSGNFYVPMDVKTPIERLNSILGTMEGAVILTTEKDRGYLSKAGYAGNCLLYEELLDKWLLPETMDTVRNGISDNRVVSQSDEWRQEVRQRKESILDTDLMYVLFTSGSTGTPKGVAVMHRSVTDYIEMSTEKVGVDGGDIIGSQTPLYADMSLKDIYMTMKSGATVCLIPQRLFMSPKKLLQYLEDHHVTMLMWVPTAYRLVSQFDALEKVRPRYLRKLLFSGESMPPAVFHYWREHYPDAEYTQLYGPSEITGACTYYRVERSFAEDETIPIGRPFPNTGILLLDEGGRVIEPMDTVTEGEICVYGTCLAAGYYNAPEKTREVFVPNPVSRGCQSLMYRTGDLARYDAEGNLVFASRKDYQVKHGGRRIELGEIETAFQAVEGIKAVCCVQNRKEDRLILYYIGMVPEEEVSLAVRERLPKYMIPAEYHRMESLPALPNGKLDRKTVDRWANETGR